MTPHLEQCREIPLSAALLLPRPAGMKCGGCVGGVKRILESQPGVTSASVNLATETALVRVLVPRSQAASTSAGGAMSPHVRQLGEQLAQVRKDSDD